MPETFRLLENAPAESVQFFISCKFCIIKWPHVFFLEEELKLILFFFPPISYETGVTCLFLAARDQKYTQDLVQISQIFYDIITNLYIELSLSVKFRLKMLIVIRSFLSVNSFFFFLPPKCQRYEFASFMQYIYSFHPLFIKFNWTKFGSDCQYRF